MPTLWLVSPNVAFQLPTHRLNVYTPWILSQCSKNGFQRTWNQTRTCSHLSPNVVSGKSSDGPWFNGKWSQRIRSVNIFKRFTIPVFYFHWTTERLELLEEEYIQHFQNKLAFTRTTSKPPCWRHHPVAPELNLILAKGPMWFCVEKDRFWPIDSDIKTCEVEIQILELEIWNRGQGRRSFRVSSSEETLKPNHPNISYII